VCDGEGCHYLSNDVRVLLGNGDGSFQAPQHYTVGTAPQSVAAGELLGQGILDIATANGGQAHGSAMLGRGDRPFRPTRSRPAGAGPGAVRVADLNGDGRLDLVTVNSDSTVSVLLGNGDGSFQPPVKYGVGAYARDVTVGHFHDPNILDLVVANSAQYGGSPSLSVLRGNGDGTFQTAVNYDSG